MTFQDVTDHDSFDDDSFWQSFNKHINKAPDPREISHDIFPAISGTFNRFSLHEVLKYVIICLLQELGARKRRGRTSFSERMQERRH